MILPDPLLIDPTSNGSVADKVLLASMGRSGSTLLANVINCENNYRILFEPFYLAQVAEVREFVYPLYLRPEVADPKYLDPAKIILEGRIHSPWIDKECSLMHSDCILIKDIRINLFLKWLYSRFQGLKVVLLLRHPCAVVQSWLMCNFGDGSVARDRILSCSELLEDFIAVNIREEYARADTAFERLLFFWCLYNKVPLQQFKCDEICVVFYENLFIDPETELIRLFSFLGRSPKQAAVSESLSRPSSTTRKSNSELAVSDNVNGWRLKVSTEQAQRAHEILALFGMEGLYCPETSVPKREKLHECVNAWKK